MSEDQKLNFVGDHTRKLLVDGRERSYLVHVPQREPAGGRSEFPLVLAFHGSGTNARIMERFCGLSDKADEAGFVVVYPNGTGRKGNILSFNGGNCCGFAQKENVDDVKFTAAMLDDLAAVFPYDQQRIYATGMSNGAVMSYCLAAQLSERIAAVAPVGGPMGTESCSPQQPVPVCHLHGTKDAYAPFAGGIGPRSLSKTNFYSVEHSIRVWVNVNGCNPIPTETELPERIADSTQVTQQIYSGGGQGSEVVLYTIHGGGHTWPGQEPLFANLGVSTKNLDANQVIWEFFQRFSR